MVGFAKTLCLRASPKPIRIDAILPHLRATKYALHHRVNNPSKESGVEIPQSLRCPHPSCQSIPSCNMPRRPTRPALKRYTEKKLGPTYPTQQSK
ncbi:hypothetical protein NMY22_g17428 [Coprinellus aureogranulatus]|nr:hypothetical protein NMY22_g17428 [Coprinellus aureogranulatus]